MAKLTPLQRKTLAEIQRWHYPTVPYQIGEALRRRGFVERHTIYEVGWDFADQSGVTPQSRHKKPHLAHRWFITPAGRQALQGEQHDDR